MRFPASDTSRLAFRYLAGARSLQGSLTSSVLALFLFHAPSALVHFLKKKTFQRNFKISREKNYASRLVASLSTPEIENMWKNEWGGKIIFAHGTRHSRGVAICFKSKLNFDIETVKTCSDGRFIYPDILTDDSPFKLLNLYAPNRAKCQTNFLLQIKNLLLKEDCINSNELIIGGDFNCVLDPSLDKKGGTESDNKSRVVNTIGLLMHTFDLHDIWRIKNPDVQKFTWRQKSHPYTVVWITGLFQTASTNTLKWPI